MCTVLLPPGDNPIAVNKYIKQRQTKTIQNNNQKSINHSDTNINGATQTLTNKLNSKFQVMDIKFFKGSMKKMRKDTIRIECLQQL
jgi:predicted transcriptional regulator